MFYEALKDVTEYGKQKWISSPNWQVNNSFEGLVLGGLAGGMSCAVFNPKYSSAPSYTFSVLLVFVHNN